MAQPAYCIAVGASTEKIAKYKRRKQKQNILILCEEGTSIPVSLIDQQVLTDTFDIAREKITYHFVKALKEWSCRAFDIESIFCDNKGKHTTFADAYRLLDKGEYSACIVYIEIDTMENRRNAWK